MHTKQPPAMRVFITPSRLNIITLRGRGPAGNVSSSQHITRVLNIMEHERKLRGACAAAQWLYRLQDADVLRAVAWILRHLVRSCLGARPTQRVTKAHNKQTHTQNMLPFLPASFPCSETFDKLQRQSKTKLQSNNKQISKHTKANQD